MIILIRQKYMKIIIHCFGPENVRYKAPKILCTQFISVVSEPEWWKISELPRHNEIEKSRAKEYTHRTPYYIETIPITRSLLSIAF